MPGKSKNSLKLLQVSDCHIPADRETDYRGQSADQNLRSLLPAMRAWNPDLLLLTGDVSEDGSAASYARVAVMLGTVGAPVLALPGNHDDPDIMRDHFPQGPWRGPWSYEWEQWLVVLLDSTAPGRIGGVLSQQSLERFDTVLRSSAAKHVLVGLHHQPIPVGAPWIDRYALVDSDRFFAFVDRDRRIRCIAWGHVHQDFRVRRNGVECLGGPSTVANSLPNTDRFTLDLAGPACRWLELGPDGRVKIGILRADQSPAGSTSQRIR